MDKTPQQLLTIAKKILAELQSLNDNLQKQSIAIAKNSQAAKQDINVTPEVRAVLNLPESEQDRMEANDKRTHNYQKRDLIIGALTLSFLIIYAITTFFIYCATDKAAIAAKDAALQARNSFDLSFKTVRADKAAILEPNIEGIDRLSLDIANRGKSIATNITGTITVSRKNLKTGSILGEPKIVPVNIPQIKGETGNNLNFDSRNLDPEPLDMASIIQLRETLIVEGEITFNDGFIKNVPLKICQELAPRFNDDIGEYAGPLNPMDCANAA